MIEEQTEIVKLDRVRLAEDLRSALERGRLDLHYQPLVRSGDGKVSGLEALVRWDHPQIGRIPPNVLLPLAEEFQLMRELGRWVLHAATAQVSEWRRSGLVREIQLHVNVSRPELEDPSIVERISAALGDSGTRPEDLCLEMTESCLRATSDEGLRSIDRLAELGVDFALDDFGRDSSINALTKAPFSQVKVERSLICGEDRPENFNRILTGIRGLTRALGITMVAEGVEDPEEVRTVAVLGFSETQGFAVGKPSEVSGTESVLRKDRGWIGSF